MKNKLYFALTILAITLALAGGSYYRAQTAQRTQAESEVAQEIGENYYTYTPEGFEEGRAQSAVVVLNFYATWCATCNELEPTIKNVMEEIGQSRNVRAYRVNFGDSAETPAGRHLAEQYGIKAQTTTLILNRDGDVFKAYFTPVPEDELKTAIVAAALVQ